MPFHLWLVRCIKTYSPVLGLVLSIHAIRYDIPCPNVVLPVLFLVVTIVEVVTADSITL